MSTAKPILVPRVSPLAAPYNFFGYGVCIPGRDGTQHIAFFDPARASTPAEIRVQKKRIIPYRHYLYQADMWKKCSIFIPEDCEIVYQSSSQKDVLTNLKLIQKAQNDHAREGASARPKGRLGLRDIDVKALATIGGDADYVRRKWGLTHTQLDMMLATYRKSPRSASNRMPLDEEELLVSQLKSLIGARVPMSAITSVLPVSMGQIRTLMETHCPEYTAAAVTDVFAEHVLNYFATDPAPTMKGAARHLGHPYMAVVRSLNKNAPHLRPGGVVGKKRSYDEMVKARGEAIRKGHRRRKVRALLSSGVSKERIAAILKVSYEELDAFITANALDT